MSEPSPLENRELNLKRTKKRKEEKNRKWLLLHVSLEPLSHGLRWHRTLLHSVQQHPHGK